MLKVKVVFRVLVWATFLILISYSGLGQVKVILDTDPSYDPDDVGCMAMLHTMASLGECQILAMVNSTNHKESALSISAINTFYNRKAIPVGDYKGYPEKINSPNDTYDGYIAKTYPRELNDWTEAIDGVRLYREILASAKDTSITVVIIGTMHNFYGLLQSRGDAFSELTGRELVGQKVKQVVTMGGNFIDGKGYDRTNWGGSEVLCSYTDWSCLNEERNRMCRYVIENCIAPFIASGWEVGCGDYYNADYGTVFTGQGLKALSEDHIVRRSYEYHFAKRGGDADISRHSNDQCALHYAILGEGQNYTAYTNGKISLSEKGECNWDAEVNKGQGYIQKKRDVQLIAEEIESLMMGEKPELDTSAPEIPKNLRLEMRNENYVLLWDEVDDDTPGSWVIAYDVYQNDNFLQRVHGTQLPGISLEQGDSFKVRAINTSDTPGRAAILDKK